jgi:hypothetical protein
MFIEEIKFIDKILIKDNSLVFIDIDETLIHFERIHNITWWKNRFNYYHNLTNNNEESNSMVIDEWTQLIITEIPKPINKDRIEKLFNTIKETNSKLILITARDYSLKDLTIRHLDSCDIHVQENDIYFTKNKGKIIQELRMNRDVIFVDDLITNIENVLMYVPDAKCYWAKFI